MTMRCKPVLVALLLAFTMLTALTACGDDDDAVPASGDGAESTTTAADSTTTSEATTTTEAEAAALQQVTVEANATTDGDMKTYSFSVPDGITAGATQFNLKNNDDEPHHVQLFKMNEDATMADVQAALQSADPVGAMLQIGLFEGGTGTTNPMSESNVDAIVDLTEGNWLLMCFIEGADGLPHLAHGMLQPFEVGPASGDTAALPEADVTIDAVNFAYPDPSLPARGTIEFVNTSQDQPHEMNVFKLAEGATQDDVTAFFDGDTPPGPPPFTAEGGVQAILPGASQEAAIDLPPGDYVLICGIPDPTDGVPHYKKGMVTTVTIS